MSLNSSMSRNFNQLKWDSVIYCIIIIFTGQSISFSYCNNFINLIRSIANQRSRNPLRNSSSPPRALKLFIFPDISIVTSSLSVSILIRAFYALSHKTRHSYATRLLACILWNLHTTEKEREREKKRYTECRIHSRSQAEAVNPETRRGRCACLLSRSNELRSRTAPRVSLAIALAEPLGETNRSKSDPFIYLFFLSFIFLVSPGEDREMQRTIFIVN